VTPADTPDDQPSKPESSKPKSSDEPITPEVIDGGGSGATGPTGRRGAAARKRRPGAAGGDVGDLSDLSGGSGSGSGSGDDGPVPPGRPVRPATGRFFRAGCLVLAALGVIELFFAAQLVLDPDDARCTAAKFEIDEANDPDDDETFDDVDLPEGEEDADDLECEQAIVLAGDIPDDEDEPADGEFTEASTFRTQGIIIAVLGLGHSLSGFFTLRTRAKKIRTAALVFTALGLFLPILGIFSVVALVFIIYALVFSADAKAIFGPVGSGGGGLFRPRPPRNP